MAMSGIAKQPSDAQRSTDLVIADTGKSITASVDAGTSSFFLLGTGYNDQTGTFEDGEIAHSNSVDIVPTAFGGGYLFDFSGCTGAEGIVLSSINSKIFNSLGAVGAVTVRIWLIPPASSPGSGYIMTFQNLDRSSDYGVYQAGDTLKTTVGDNRGGNFNADLIAAKANQTPVELTVVIAGPAQVGGGAFEAVPGSVNIFAGAAGNSSAYIGGDYSEDTDLSNNYTSTAIMRLSHEATGYQWGGKILTVEVYPGVRQLIADSRVVPSAPPVVTKSWQLQSSGLVPPNPQTGTSYTLAASDCGKIITLTDVETLYIPNNASVPVPIGYTTATVNTSATPVTIDGSSSITINGVTGGNATLPQNIVCTFIQTSIDAWIAIGVEFS